MQTVDTLTRSLVRLDLHCLLILWNLKILWHDEHTSQGDNEISKEREKKQKQRWEYIKELTGMVFGGKGGKVCCNVICGAPTAVSIKGLVWDLCAAICMCIMG